jgi:hypothetical protein
MYKTYKKKKPKRPNKATRKKKKVLIFDAAKVHPASLRF